MNRFTPLWIGWGLAFFGIEIPALPEQATLSEHLRTAFAFDETHQQPRAFGRARRASFTLIVSWFWWHISSKKHGVSRSN